MGVQFARAHGCLFVETSAKGNVAVEQAFEELVLKVRLLLRGSWCSGFSCKCAGRAVEHGDVDHAPSER